MWSVRACCSTHVSCHCGHSDRHTTRLLANTPPNSTIKTHRAKHEGLCVMWGAVWGVCVPTYAEADVGGRVHA